MRAEFLTHWSCLLLLPHWSHTSIVCDDPDCGAVHGWVMQIGWLFWSVEIESSEFIQ